MSRRRSRPRFHEPSLVPMADMLSNTVGVVLFILIFTVLTAGGAVLAKRLPMERPTKAQPIALLCAFGRIAPLDNVQDVVKAFLQPLGTTVAPGEFQNFVDRFTKRRLETADFIVTGEAQGALMVVLRPKPGNGETANDVLQPKSKFRTLLAQSNPQEKFTKFYIFPSGVTTFRVARDIAASASFGTGWVLMGADETLRVCVAGCSGGGAETVK